MINSGLSELLEEIKETREEISLRHNAYIYTGLKVQKEHLQNIFRLLINSTFLRLKQNTFVFIIKTVISSSYSENNKYQEK